MTKFYMFISWFIVFLYWFIISFVTVRIFMKRRVVPSAIAWLLIIYIFPLFGIIAYLSFGERNLGTLRTKRTKKMWLLTSGLLNTRIENRRMFETKYSEVALPLFKLCHNLQGINGIKCNQIQILTTTETTLIELIRDIELARHNIDMMFYIWKPGGLVDHVTESLISAAKRGVRCRVLLDSAGSIYFFRSSYPDIMRNAGIVVVEALKVNLLLFFLRRMDLRHHRKVVLIDNYIAYTGSMNMADPKFFPKKSGMVPWIDLMARMEGPIVHTIGIVYACDWERETGQSLIPPKKLPKSTLEQDIGSTIQVIASGPGFTEEIIHQSLLTAVYASREQLVMTTPYFVPSENLLHAICTAALRGVEVIIIVPRDNDSLLVRWASRYFFSELLEAGVKIYQFEGGILHTKSVLVDVQLSLIGTVNIDMRSLWLNFEITLVIDDNNFGNDLYCVQEDYMASSKIMNIKKWNNRPFWQKVLEKIFYFFSPFL